MNDYTARLLRAELNSDRQQLEAYERELHDLDTKRSQSAKWIAEARQRIAALSTDLEADGKSTQPWPNPFTENPAA